MTTSELRFVQVDADLIAYREAGQGEPLVLLHGFLCDSRCWTRQLGWLSDQFRVVAWDAPGAGLSADPPETFTTADYARRLDGFLDALAIRRAHIVGLSWGGILAQEFYRRFPHRFSSLVLTDTYAGWRGSLPEAVWKERLDACLRGSEEPAAALVAKMLPGMFTDEVGEDVREEQRAIMTDFHPVGFRVMSRSSAETDSRDLLPTIKVPTLVLWGADDRRSPLHIAEQLHAAIANSQLAVIPKAGHVSNMEQPEAFNAHIRLFCAEHPAV